MPDPQPSGLPDCCSLTDGFTFPTSSENKFIVGDLVNVTWDVVAPLISLFEVCDDYEGPLEETVNNTYSYVWTATRMEYVVHGCFFMLQPFTAQGEAYGNNVTSVTFGVSKRYTDDPPPVSYNFITTTTSSTSSSPPATATGTPAPSMTTSLSTETPSATTASAEETTLPATDSGLSQSSKIGIGLGVPLGVLVVALLVGAFLIYRRRKARQQEALEMSAAQWPADGLAPLPTFEDKDNPRHHARLSQTETVISELSSENYRTREDARPISELMHLERTELD